jgi:hypothetical protein
MKTLLPVIAFLLFGPCSLAQTLSQSNLPIVLINTNDGEIVDEPKITAHMGIIDNASGINNVDDPFNDYNGTIAIELRGSSSQWFPKKQYGLELKDELANDVSASLLGLPAEEDWILFAPYNDKSLIRDALAYKLGRDMGRYASRSRFCELVLNGQYMGVYLLLEKIKRDINRVDISNLAPDENTGDNVTGGYILKIDKATGNGDAGWNSPQAPLHRAGGQTITFFYEYPSAEDITSQQQQYIQGFMQQFESSLKSSNFDDPVAGYARFIDVDSFIDFLIINEISRNVDGYRISTFFHKQKVTQGGKLVMGPIWDFNLGFGNADYCSGNKTTGFAFEFNSICPQDWWLVPFWWERLMEDPAFKRKLGFRWFHLRSASFSDDAIQTYLDSIKTSFDAGAQQRNFEKWQVLGTYVWPNAFVGDTYEEEINWLKDWIADRSTWLDATFEQFVTANEEEISTQRFIAVDENPFEQELSLSVTVSNASMMRLILCDNVGKEMIDLKRNLNQGNNQIKIETPGLARGIYYLKIDVHGETQVFRIAKK